MRKMVGTTILLVSALLVSLSIIARAQSSSLGQRLSPLPTRATNTASQPAGEPAGRLPVKRVVLYKNGIGYFEHTTRIRGAQELNIDFTSAQLNDVLNSLTVVDLGEGHIAGVRFNSVAPVSERLKALRLPLAEQTSRLEFLSALRGTRVEVHGGGASAAGRVLSVEARPVANPKGEQLTQLTELSLVTDSGELRSFEMGPGTSVRIADRDLNDEVGHYLNLIASTNAIDLRRMTVSAVGAGEREVFVSYISEVPVWKSTYRILLADKPGDKPLIQGWAIVDNTIGEDWKDVRLSLVAGAPQSFIQEISQPYYMHRPVVALPQSMTLTPQTHEAALMAMVAPPPPPPSGGAQAGVGGGMGMGPGVAGRSIGGPAGPTGLEGTVKDPSGDAVSNAKVTVRNEEGGASQTTRTDSQGHYRFVNIQPGNSALFVESPGFQRFALTSVYLGIGRMNEIHPALSLGGGNTETVEVTAAPPTVNTESSMVSLAAENEGPEAQGKGIGDLFEYDIRQNVTIGKNQSALVPILQARIEAEKVTLWNEDQDVARRALWITNTSGETLDAGSINVLESETFAGQGLLDAVHAGEKRLISYAADPAVRVKVEEDSSQKPISRVVINKGVMMTTREQRERKTYKVSNSDAAAREVVIEHPARSGWKLDSSLKPDESSASFHRFKVRVEPRQSAELKVEEFHPETTELALTELTSDQVTLLTEQQRVTPAMLQAFRQVLGQKTAIAGLDANLKSRLQETKEIDADQVRLRENMKALKGSAEERSLLARYTHQLDTQEDRLAALGVQIAGLREKREQAGEQLDRTLTEISLNETF